MNIYRKSDIPAHLQEYFAPAEIGLEPTPDAYVDELVAVFREVRRVLRDDGTLWLNLGDSYNAAGRVGHGTRNGCKQGTNRASATKADNCRPSVEELKPKDLIGIPWRVAFALQADGWWLRQDIIWCLSGGARVYARTQKGDMPMMVKDLVRLKPETVKLWNGAKWTQVRGWSKSQEPRECALEIELASGERIGCTVGHVWPTQRGNIRTDALAVGDVIETTQLPAMDTPANPFALDDELGWLCGLYLAEGSMSADTVQIAGHTAQTPERFTRIERIAHAFHGTARAHIYENKATININGPVLQAAIRAYIHGDTAKRKGLKVRVWQRGNGFLLALLRGYLDGDGHYDAANDRWRLGFTRNDRLAADLRTVAARLGLSIRLAPCMVDGFGRQWPAYRGDIRLTPTTHHNARQDGEVVAICQSRAREFWDIGVEDEPHLFALASGVLTHNSKPNPMPESVTDRCTKSHEYIFMLTKCARYYYDAAAIREPASEAMMRQISEGYNGSDTKLFADSGAQSASGTKSRIIEGKRKALDKQRGHERPHNGFNNHWDAMTKKEQRAVGSNKRSVWNVATAPFNGSHFATFPPDLIKPCILAGTKPRDAVLDPFGGSGTTGMVALELGRRAVLIELNEAYAKICSERCNTTAGLPLG